VRLVRDLLAADAEPEVAQAGAPERARRLLDVVAGGLGLRAGAVLVRAAPGGDLTCVASTLPEPARAVLVDPAGRTMTVLRKAVDERRAFLMRAASDDPLLRALHDADAAIEAVAVLPLADRGPIGVLVLAAGEAALAAETLRTLTTDLRLFALLVSPLRDAAPPVPTTEPAADPAAREELEAARAEIDRQTYEIAQLRQQIEALEGQIESAANAAGPTAGAVAAAAAATSREVGDLVATASAMTSPSGSTPLVVVVDASKVWESYAIRDHSIVVVSPTSELASQVRALGPARVIVNLTVSGAFDSIASLHAGSHPLPVWGVVADTTNERVVGLGMIDAVGRQPTPEALFTAVDRQAPRSGRVFAAGRDADALMKMRQLLAKQGFSVSMARDTKQITELVDMVKPQVVVVDLQLPMREGYELILRASSLSPIPSLVVIPCEGDPAPTLAEKLRDRLASGQGMGAKQWLTDLVARKIAAVENRPKPAHAAPRAT